MYYKKLMLDSFWRERVGNWFEGTRAHQKLSPLPSILEVVVHRLTPFPPLSKFKIHTPPCGRFWKSAPNGEWEF